MKTMTDIETTGGSVATSPMATIGLVVIALTLVVGSGSYFSSKQKALEPTSAQTAGLFEMVFQSR